MKKYICILSGVALLAACEQKETTINTPPAEKKESNTTIVKESPASFHQDGNEDEHQRHDFAHSLNLESEEASQNRSKKGKSPERLMRSGGLESFRARLAHN